MGKGFPDKLGWRLAYNDNPFTAFLSPRWLMDLPKEVGGFQSVLSNILMSVPSASDNVWRSLILKTSL